jgi:hypothetical protein
MPPKMALHESDGSAPHLSFLGDVSLIDNAGHTKTREYITEQATLVGFAEGNAWNQMIWDLIRFADERGLSTRITHFDDPNQGSPFVRFVRELQLTFPTEFRRHEASNAALTEAISVARRQIGRAIASRKAQKANEPE